MKEDDCWNRTGIAQNWNDQAYLNSDFDHSPFY